MLIKREQSYKIIDFLLISNLYFWYTLSESESAISKNKLPLILISVFILSRICKIALIYYVKTLFINYSICTLFGIKWYYLSLGVRKILLIPSIIYTYTYQFIHFIYLAQFFTWILHKHIVMRVSNVHEYCTKFSNISQRPCTQYSYKIDAKNCIMWISNYCVRSHT